MFRVIIVDHDERSRKAFWQTCRDVEEIELVGIFADPLEALRFAEEHQFEVAVLAVMMPGMDGMELGRRLRELNPDLIPIFMTASKDFAYEAYQLDAAAYLLKPLRPSESAAALERAKRLSCGGAEHQVFLRTFGHFDVFVDGKPLKFSRQKSKEILAYLVDRRGGTATVAQIIADLWEDRAGEPGVRARYQAAFKDLRRDLRAAGVDALLISARNQKAIDMSVVECDYYQMLRGDQRALQCFPGEYMAEYSWAEPTNALCAALKRHYDKKND